MLIHYWKKIVVLHFLLIIFADFSYARDRVFTVELSLKAILDNYGIASNNKDILEKINEEQGQVREKLSAISPDIKIIFKYKYLFNGFALKIPKQYIERVKQIVKIKEVDSKSHFKKASAYKVNDRFVESENAENYSGAKFIGAKLINEDGIKGDGIHVAVVDTGIDYTHNDFSPSHNINYDDNNPNIIEKGTFPTNKVVGGFDFVGSSFNPNSKESYIPKPDGDPLDENGHGTVIAGIIGGVSNSSMAPNSKLHSLKVFGKKGGTYEYILLAALEYCVDPNNDGDTSDHVDIVNLSLGGKAKSGKLSLLGKSIDSLVDFGVSVVISAGNFGSRPYSIGDPAGATDKSISVAASSDNQPINWQFDNIRFITVDNDNNDVIAENVFFASPISSELSGKVLKVVKDDDKNKINGNAVILNYKQSDSKTIAAISNLYKLGAKGIIIESKDNSKIVGLMGYSQTIDIPCVIVSRDNFNQIDHSLETSNQEVRVSFWPGTKTRMPWLIDNVISMSSRGPRIIDAKIKPEITAPGQNILSASIGTGSLYERSTGTSMAAAHISGAIALLKNFYPKADPSMLKRIIMNNSKVLSDSSGKVVPVTKQGAGRISLVKALNSKVSVNVSSLSFGVIDHSKKLLKRELLINNSSEHDVIINLGYEKSSNVEINSNENIEIKPYSNKLITLIFKLHDVSDVNIYSGWVILNSKFSNGKMQKTSIPFYGMKRTTSKLAVSTKEDGTTFLMNKGLKKAESYYLFNKLFYRQTGVSTGETCEYTSIGYNISESGHIEIGINMKHDQLSWKFCKISMKIYANDELIAFAKSYQENKKTVVFDYKSLVAGNGYKKSITGIGDFKAFDLSSLAIAQIPISSLKVANNSNITLSIDISSNSNIIENSDYFSGKERLFNIDIQNILNNSFEDILPKSNKLINFSSDRVLFIPSNPVNSDVYPRVYSI